MIFGKTGKRGKFSEAQSTAEKAYQEVEKAREDIRKLEDKIEHLVIICQALWSFIREKEQLSEKDLEEKIKSFQSVASDDETQNVNTKACVECGRTINRKQAKCIYCGAEQPLNSIFDAI